jgi:hypothetical protein
LLWNVRFTSSVCLGGQIMVLIVASHRTYKPPLTIAEQQKTKAINTQQHQPVQSFTPQAAKKQEIAKGYIRAATMRTTFH